MNCANCGDPIRPTEERDGMRPEFDGSYEFEYVHDSGPDLGGNPICPIPCIATPEAAS